MIEALFLPFLHKREIAFFKGHSKEGNLIKPQTKEGN